MKEDITSTVVHSVRSTKKWIPVIIVLSFMAVLGTVSFAFFGFSNITNVSIFANVSTLDPAIYKNKSISITKKDCALSLNMNKMTRYSASNTTPVETSYCGILISMTGNKNDTCSFRIRLEDVSSIPYTHTDFETFDGVTEYSYYPYQFEMEFPSGSTDYKIGDARPYDNITVWSASWANMPIDVYDGNIFEGLLKIPSSGTMVAYEVDLETKFYNLVGVDQSGLLKSNTANTIYRHQLKVTDLSCDWSHY